MGLAKVRRHGESVENLQSGNLQYTRGRENVCQSGVEFLIHKEIANNVTDLKTTLDGVAMIVFKLSNRYNMKIIKAYSEKLKKVYEQT